MLFSVSIFGGNGVILVKSLLEKFENHAN